MTDAVNAGESGRVAVDDNLLSQEDSDTLFELYDKAQENEGGIFGIGALGLSVDDSKKLTDLVILDQVGNALISKYKYEPSSLSNRELVVLGEILNYYYASGGNLRHIQRLLSDTGPSYQSPNYLFNSGTGGVYEDIFDKAAITRNLDAEARRYDQIGEAVWGAPGKFMNIARMILGADTAATGVQNIQQGNTGLGVFQVGVGGLMFIPINGRPVPANIAYSSVTPNTRVITGAVATRINVANSSTRFTPLNKKGKPYAAGFIHVVDKHFDAPIANNVSIFNISPNTLRTILRESNTVNTPVISHGDGTFSRVVNTGRVIGTTSIRQGQSPTTYIKIFTDAHGNLLTTYPPVKGN